MTLSATESVWSATPAPSEGPLSRHLLSIGSSVGSDGRLRVAGLDVCELVDEFSSPLFIYDEGHLTARCAEAVAAFGLGVAYASKAFLCVAMAKIALEAGMSIDVSTDGELEVALRAGVPADRIVFHGNNKSDAEIARAVELSVGRIIVDSLDEIDRLRRHLVGRHGAPRRQRVHLRITPGIEAHTHEFVMTGQEDSKFGFSVASGMADQAVTLLRSIPEVELAGVHAHIGSQIFLLDAYDRALEVVVAFAERYELPELCIGGGLGVAYLNDERAPSITAWAEDLKAAAVRLGLDPSVTLSAEPGRSIVADAALTCYRVGTIKEIPGVRTYVAVDGGMSDNPRPVLYGSGYEAFLPREVDAPRPYAARIVGKHCESGDVLVAEARLPADVHVGDVLATPVTGAYGYSMASTYNRVPRPAVLFVRDGVARIAQRRETVEDLLALEP